MENIPGLEVTNVALQNAANSADGNSTNSNSLSSRRSRPSYVNEL